MHCTGAGEVQYSENFGQYLRMHSSTRLRVLSLTLSRTSQVGITSIGGKVGRVCLALVQPQGYLLSPCPAESTRPVVNKIK